MILHKYQVLGNDFLIFDCISYKENAEFLKTDGFLEFVQKKSDRRRIGCDQFIVITPSKQADAKIEFYNADSTKAEACGNGTVASAVYFSSNIVKQASFPNLETDAGVVSVAVDVTDNRAIIELPKPHIFSLHKDDTTTIQKQLGNLQPKSIEYVSVGNPHCVLFFEEFTQELLQNWQEIGKKIENMPIFKNRTNVEFVQKIGHNIFDVLVWERGAGRTFACGTGACATAFVMAQQGGADPSKPIYIKMEGSTFYGENSHIKISIKKNTISLTNTAYFEGKIEV